MITLLDTNVLIDVFGSDPQFGLKSADGLRQCLKEGALQACEVVWTETASMFPSQAQFLASMTKLGVEFSPINQESALLAAESWKVYIQSGGIKRQRVAADFLIGAHAMNQGGRLLTRDRGFFRTYFQGLTVIDPSI